MSDSNSLRCAACDTLFRAQWHQDTKRFEELCYICLPLALGYTQEDDVMSELSDILALPLGEYNE